MRYRNSKIWSGRIAPGKRTRGSGNRGSSTVSSGGGGGPEVGCFSGNDDAEQRRRLGLLAGVSVLVVVGVLGFKPNPDLV